MAVVDAYMLAGELFDAGGDHKVAFAQYEAKYRGYASISQKINAGRLLAPSTRFGIRMRNVMFSALTVFGPLMKLVDRPATKLKLEDCNAGRVSALHNLPVQVEDPPQHAMRGRMLET